MGIIGDNRKGAWGAHLSCHLTPRFWNFHDIQQYKFFFCLFSLFYLSSFINSLFIPHQWWHRSLCVGEPLAHKKSWACIIEMAQQIKTLATKPDDLNSIPRNHMREGENQLLQIVLWLPHNCYERHIPTDIYINTYIYINKYRNVNLVFLDCVFTKYPSVNNLCFILLFFVSACVHARVWCVCVSAAMCMPQFMCTSRRTPVLFSLWVPGIKFKSSGLQNKQFHSLSHLIHLCFHVCSCHLFTVWLLKVIVTSLIN